MMVSPSGKEVWRLPLFAFASKRTSIIEEHYQPYVLEFAALKYSLGKISDITWGFPIELETDCQARRDQLLRPKVNLTHGQWCDGVLSHNIVGVRHCHLDAVADILSRKFVYLPLKKGDRHMWTELGGQGGTGVRYFRGRRWGPRCCGRTEGKIYGEGVCRGD